MDQQHRQKTPLARTADAQLAATLFEDGESTQRVEPDHLHPRSGDRLLAVAGLLHGASALLQSCGNYRRRLRHAPSSLVGRGAGVHRACGHRWRSSHRPAQVTIETLVAWIRGRRWRALLDQDRRETASKWAV